MISRFEIAIRENYANPRSTTRAPKPITTRPPQRR